jgi:hypothetical protein
MTRKPYTPPTLRRLRESTCGSKGRVRIHLGRRHPWAQASGQQWRNRLRVMLEIGRPLGQDEQVDHADGDRLHDRIENLRVFLCDKEWNHHFHRLPMVIVAEHVPGLGFIEYDTPQPLKLPF